MVGKLLNFSVSRSDLVLVLSFYDLWRAGAKIIIAVVAEIVETLAQTAGRNGGGLVFVWSLHVDFALGRIMEFGEHSLFIGLFTTADYSGGGGVFAPV